MNIDPNDRAEVEEVFGGHIYGALGVVPNTEFHVWRGGFFYQRDLPGGRIDVYPGVTLWRWYIEVDKRTAISAVVYPTPQLAMARGQLAFDAVLAGGAPTIDWDGDPRGGRGALVPVIPRRL
jgi:hypothetical protein